MKILFIIPAIIIIVMAFQQLSGFTSTSPIFLNGGSPQSQNKDKGIGPFQNVKLNPVDLTKAKNGAAIYNSKCILCHELDNKKVGPPLRNIVKDFTPEFILNMIVNPLEMQKNNATVKDLLKKFNNVPMPDQKLSQPDALLLLEYLRSVTK